MSFVKVKRSDLKNLLLFIISFLCVKQFKAQVAVQEPVYKNRLFVHYYPSTLIVGDVSFGFEYLYKKRISQELSLGVKSFQTKIYYFDKGFRLDYLFKYNWFEDDQFRFSTNISILYKDVYFRDKQIYYYTFANDVNSESRLYQVLREDRRHSEYGAGLGFSLNFKICKNFFIAGDAGLNFVKYKVIYNYNKIIYRNSHYPYTNDVQVPATYVTESSWRNLSPVLRLKVTYLIIKK